MESTALCLSLKVELLCIAIGSLILSGYVWISVALWAQFKTNTSDLAIFIQEAKTWASGELPTSTFRGGDGFNRLGDHFSPINALNAIPYSIWPSGLTLSIIQGVLIAFSVVIILRAAIKRLGLAFGIVVGVLYGVSFGLVSTVASSFHEVAYAVPLLAISGAFFLEKRYLRSLFWSFPLVFVKEDLGVTVAIIAFVLAWTTHNWKYLFGAIWGIVWTALSILVIIPMFHVNRSYDQGYIFQSLSENEFITSSKLLMVATLILVVGGLCFFSKWSLLALPTVAWRFIADNERITYMDYWYGATLMPILFIAAIQGFTLLREWRGIKLPVTLLALAAVCGLTFTSISYGVKDALPTNPDRVSKFQEIMDLIPADAVLDSNSPFSDRFAPDHPLYCSADCYQFAWEKSIPIPDYAVFNGRNNPRSSWIARAEERWPEAKFELIYENTYGDWVLKRVS